MIQLPGQLRRKHVDLADLWWLRQELWRLCHQGRCHPPGEMRLAPGFIRKGVEDAKTGAAHAEGEPGDRVRLLLDNRQTALKKLFYLRFLPRFCSRRTYKATLTMLVTPFWN